MGKRQTIFLITIVVVLIAEIATLFSVNLIRTDLANKLIDDYTKQEKAVGDQVSRSLTQEVESIGSLIQTAIIDDEIKNGTSKCNEKLEQIIKTTGGRISNLGRVGKDGKFICSVNKTLIGTSAFNLGQYISDIFNDPEHKPVMSRVIKVTTPTLVYAVAVHYPVFDTNKNFIGTLGGAIYLNQVNDRFLKDIKIGESGYTALIDDDLQILYHPQQNLIGKNLQDNDVIELLGRDQGFIDKVNKASEGIESTYRYSFGNEEKIASFFPVNIFWDRIWVAIVTVPLSEAEKIVTDVGLDQKFNSISLIITMALFLESVVLFTYITFTVLNPIRKLTLSMKRVSEGDYDEEIRKRRFNKNDEIDIMIQAFNIMAEKLKQSVHGLQDTVRLRTAELEKEKTSLEEKVQERTTELSESNEELESKVKERTKELQNKVEDLEKLNSIMVSRETKMVELKDEVNRLKKLVGEAPIDL